MRTHANTHELHNAHMHTDSLATFAHHIYIKSIHIHIEYFAVCAHTFVHIRTYTQSNYSLIANTHTEGILCIARANIFKYTLHAQNK